jgi:hypothetical protein
VVAAQTRRRQSGGAEDGGRRPYLVARERDWVLARIAEKPDLTLRALVPVLSRGDIVVMDNLGSHKGRAVRAAIRAAGAKLFFLPAYSPNLNPIEQAFPKMKTLLRKADARRPNTLGEPSALCSKPSRPPNAQTTSATQDKLPPKKIAL